MTAISESLFADRLVAFRRDLHEHPELSWQEHRTTEKIEARLDELGIAHRRVLETGVIADLPGPEGVPHVALRADIDALPIQEETGLPFTSRNDGVMHACGHDGHTTMLMGGAELLLRSPLPAPVRLLFQPAEEKGVGAKAFVEAGVLEGVGMIFGGHVDRHYPVGNIIVSDGPVNASTDAFYIELTGQGGHAARPHEAVDSVVVGSLLIMAIQTIVSREINPAHPSVVTVGRFDAGTAPNVIAQSARLEGTIRAQENDVRTHLRKSVTRIAESIALLHGAKATVEFREGVPPVINTSEMASLARDAAKTVVHPDRIGELLTPNMGAEDFAVYLEHVPGCYVRFGAVVDGSEGYPAHSSKFDIHEGVLPVGAAWYDAVARLAGTRLAANAS